MASTNDLGSHVVVCNTRHIAAKDNSRYWKRFLYPSYTRFGCFRRDETMEEIHRRDPTELQTIPEDIISNLSGVIPRVMPIPKRLDEYTTDELNEFPKLFDWPQNFLVAPLGYLAKPSSDT